jgi:PAS domain S-box-containing protein
MLAAEGIRSVTQPYLFRFLPIGRLRAAAAAGVVMLVFGVIIVFLSADLLRQIETESESRSDNAQWALSQVEVELMHFLLALDAARNGSGDLSAVRLRFDVFYSRLQTLRVGKVYAGLRQQPPYIDAIARLSAFLEDQLPLIDGPDTTLTAALPQIYANARQTVADARTIALTGLEVIARQSDQKRHGVVRTLVLTAAVTAVMIAVLMAMVVVLFQLFRDSRKRSAENLVTLSRLDAIVETAMEAIITVDSAGRIVDFNDAACATLGYARTEAIGTDMALLRAVQVDGRLLFRVGGAPDFEGRGRLRVTARHKDGHCFPAEMSISRTGTGDAALYVAFLRDLSVQIAAEKALITARDEALAGEKAKADLLVVMSHEIRTPLNGMIGTMQLLDSTDLTPHQREYLRIMETSGQLLMHHVNDVLDIARLDSGKAPFSLARTDLAALVGEVIENQMPASHANGNVMSFSGPPDGRSLVLCDAARLRQVLLNLVGNAVKFTRNGKILIAIAHGADTGPTDIVISDTGIGIPKADLSRIFDDFVTLDASYARRAAGTGLGLGIVRRIVDQMGGQLQVESQEGRGSLFRISLQLTILGVPEGPAARPEGPTAKVRPLVVLVVDDNEFNRMIVRTMLVQDGHQVVEAQDGAESIALAQTQQFDLILMDISMPQMDGLQAARAILTNYGTSCRAPIVAMTAHALAEEGVRFRNGGMREVLVKPITREVLRAVIANLPEVAPAPLRLIDPAVLRSLAQDLGLEKAAALVSKFLAEAGRIVGHVADGVLSAKPDDAVLRDLHRLQGSAAMFGTEILHAYLSDVETDWKEGRVDLVNKRLKELRCIWENTERAVQDTGVFAQVSSFR